MAGLASNFDWLSLVDQLAEAERLPQQRLLEEQTVLQNRNTAYGSLVTQLKVLQNRVTALQDADLFQSRLATVGDSAVATATASPGAVQGAYTFQFLQLATAARQVGASNTGRALHATNDVSGLVLADAGFATAVTAGTFTVNGRQVTLATTDTLQQVFDKIGTATGGMVTGEYDAVTDRLTLTSSSGDVLLGSATDTSNFLQVARLNNNGTDSVSSAGPLGGVRLSAALSGANLQTAVADGGGGGGRFKINGVEIAYQLTDSVANVLQRINESAAGVLASYDPLNDRFLLANKTTGDVGIALEDVSGNFLAATGLSGGSLQRGKDLLYTVDGGGQLTSHSNTIDEDSSGLAGLTVTALQAGETTTVTVSGDTAKVKSAINGFLEEFNRVQSLLDSQTASTTDAKGKVTAGILANDSEANEVGGQLRALANTVLSGFTGGVTSLEKLGIVSNGEDNTLRLEDETRLDAALRDQAAGVEALFTHSTTGLATTLNAYLEKLAGDDGTLLTKQDNLTRQAGNIDTQVADLERVVQANRDRLIQSFIAMEKAQAQINQQLQFLEQRFGTSNS